ncbi:hypothetical protein C3V43_05565 [Bacteroides heparinolyticus]|nr:hypothetical protein C3V43_05565 [Bacteroides heparinolyticus]
MPQNPQGRRTQDIHLLRRGGEKGVEEGNSGKRGKPYACNFLDADDADDADFFIFYPYYPRHPRLKNVFGRPRRERRNINGTWESAPGQMG